MVTAVPMTLILCAGGIHYPRSRLLLYLCLILYMVQVEEEPGNEAGWNNSSVLCVLYTFCSGGFTGSKGVQMHLPLAVSNVFLRT